MELVLVPRTALIAHTIVSLHVASVETHLVILTMERIVKPARPTAEHALYKNSRVRAPICKRESTAAVMVSASREVVSALLPSQVLPATSAPYP